MNSKNKWSQSYVNAWTESEPNKNYKIISYNTVFSGYQPHHK